VNILGCGAKCSQTPCNQRKSGPKQPLDYFLTITPQAIRAPALPADRSSYVRIRSGLPTRSAIRENGVTIVTHRDSGATTAVFAVPPRHVKSACHPRAGHPDFAIHGASCLDSSAARRGERRTFAHLPPWVCGSRVSPGVRFHQVQTNAHALPRRRKFAVPTLFPVHRSGRP